MTGGSSSTSSVDLGTYTAEHALKIVLDNIASGDLVNDRYTKLTCRQVCRDWRAHSAFSDPIASVTLRSANDANQLIKYFPVVPCVRSPWRTLEESGIFTKLRSVNVCLGDEVEIMGHSDSLQAVCRQFELSIAMQSFTDLAAQWPLYSSIGTVVAVTVGERNQATKWAFDNHPRTLSLGGFGSMLELSSVTRLALHTIPVTIDYNKMGRFINLRSLSRITQEALNELLASADFQSQTELRSLSKLGYLRHLEIGLVFEESHDLRDALQALATLTQITHLDLELHMTGDPDNFYRHVGNDSVDISRMESSIQLYAPQSLKRCTLHNVYGRIGFSERYIRVYLDQASFKLGKLCDCHFRFNVFPADGDGGFEESVLGNCVTRTLAQWDAQRVQIYVTNKDVQRASRLISFTNALKGIKELDIEVHRDGRMGKDRDGGEVVLGEIFDDLCDLVSTTLLHIYLGEVKEVKYTELLGQLPRALPNLQQLELKDGYHLPTSFHALSQLTGLTYLSLDLYTYTPFRTLNISTLPPLLKDLKVRVFSLEPAPVPPLLHLTRLRLSVREGGDPLSLFSQAAAPLKDLTLQGQQSLDALPVLFPRLEKLKLCLFLGELASLVGLKLLRDLEIELPYEHEVPRGLSQLTQVWKLNISRTHTHTVLSD